MHEIKPITSGYRLALSYNLVHTTNSLRPATSNDTSVLEEVHRIFKLWKADAGEYSQEKIIYLLDYKYSQANLNASALKGADAHRVALLENLARQYGFDLGLAHAVCHLIGPCDEGGYYDGYSGRYGYDVERDADMHPCRYGGGRPRHGESSLSFADIEERRMTIEHFVDLEGRLISKTLADKKKETIPADLTEDVEEDESDEEEFEGYQGNVSRLVLFNQLSPCSGSAQYAGSLERCKASFLLVKVIPAHRASQGIIARSSLSGRAGAISPSNTPAPTVSSGLVRSLKLLADLTRPRRNER